MWRRKKLLLLRILLYEKEKNQYRPTNLPRITKLSRLFFQAAMRKYSRTGSTRYRSHRLNIPVLLRSIAKNLGNPQAKYFRTVPLYSIVPAFTSRESSRLGISVVILLSEGRHIVQVYSSYKPCNLAVKSGSKVNLATILNFSSKLSDVLTLTGNKYILSNFIFR